MGNPQAICTREVMMASKQVRSGLDSPLRLSCQPCHHVWDAVVHMETFDRKGLIGDLVPILNIVARDSKAILAAFGKSPTLEHLNQHQRKNREDLEKVHLKFSSFYDLFSKVQHLFVGCGRETVRYVIERYRLDFLMCGYKRTLEQLEQLL